MRIIFVRHGHPNYEKDCLTELGHLHAAAVANRLAGEGIEAIYSSTCGRAHETAGYVARKLGLDIVKCDFMREISWGSVNEQSLKFNGHPWDTVDHMVANNESILEADWADKEPFVHNKLVADVQMIADATDAWLESLGYKREGKYYRVCGNIIMGSHADGALPVDCALHSGGDQRPTCRTIAAFGHGGASAAILSHMFNLPFPFTCSVMGPDYTGITVVTLPDNKGCLVTPRFEILNDARHIAGLKVENVYNR